MIYTQTSRPGMINAYVCMHLHCTVTVDRADGIIPDTINCEICNTPARSRNYHVSQDLEPDFEWRKPNFSEIPTIEAPTMANVNKGLLLLFMIEERFDKLVLNKEQ